MIFLLAIVSFFVGKHVGTSMVILDVEKFNVYHLC